MRWLSFTLLIAAAITVVAFFKTENNISAPAIRNKHDNPVKVKVSREAALLRLGGITKGLKNYAGKNGFNNRYCFLVDMKMPSGSKRFHVFDLQNNQIIQSGLVAHGSGNQHLSDSIVFSNVVGSNCTSLGRYKIGKPYFGKFGLAYKLYGLDKTNSNAFNRFVVLHAHACVPDKTVEPLQICESWGCPTVSPVFLSSLKTYIEKSEQPLLLWIFN
jgi:L,D-transpeptidase catalytic domain